MRTSVENFFWYALIAMLAASALAFSILIYIAIIVYGVNLQHGADSSDKGTNLLGIVYFLSNTLVALIAAFSIIFARTQIKHGEESRRASVYLELDKRYNEEKVQYSVRLLSSLRIKYETDKRAGECLAQFGHRYLLTLRERHIQEVRNNPEKDTEYRKSLYLLMLFEYLGVLVGRNYLKGNDLFDFMGAVIVTAEDITKDHIKWIRGQANDPKIFANTLFLMKMARTARPTTRTFNEGDYQIPAHGPNYVFPNRP